VANLSSLWQNFCKVSAQSGRSRTVFLADLLPAALAVRIFDRDFLPGMGSSKQTAASAADIAISSPPLFFVKR
jgi:hypothetical protein